MKTVTVPVIKSDEDLHAALERIRLLLGNADEESEDEIGVLALVIEDYENKYVPFRDPDPIEVIEFVLKERGLKESDLIPYIGSHQKVSDVLNRSLPLTVDMIGNISEDLSIPAGALIGVRHKTPAA